MRPAAALLALIAAIQLPAQGFEDPMPPSGGALPPASSPAAQPRVVNKPGEVDPAFARLKSISYFFIDVRTSENRPDDADLRNELRDLMELEMRRAGVSPREQTTVNPDANAPQLIIEIRFDRGLGRYAAAVGLSVRDEANIRRNNQLIIAETYRSERSALGTSDLQLTRDIKAKAKELMTELLDGMAKAKGR